MPENEIVKGTTDNSYRLFANALVVKWRILLASGLILFFCLGIEKSETLLHSNVIEHFEQDQVALTSLIFSIKLLLQFCTAPIVSYLCQRFGYAFCITIGCISVTSGFISSAYVTSIETLFFTYSFLTGAGFSLTATSAFLLTSINFSQTRGLALGIVTMLGSLGGLIYPPLIALFKEEYGYEGTFLLLGGVMYHLCIAATLVCGHEAGPENIEEIPTETVVLSYASANKCGWGKRDAEESEKTPTHDKENAKEKSTEKSALLDKKASTITQIMDLLALPLYSSFAIFILTAFMFAYMAKVVHFANICAEKFMEYTSRYDDVNEYDVTYLLVAISLSDIISRPLSGVLFDSIPTACGRINVYLIMCVWYSLSLLIFGKVPGYNNHLLLVVVIISSVLSSICYTQSTTVAVLLVPNEQLPEAVGIVRFFQGVGVLLGPYITGLAADDWGGSMIILYCGAFVLFMGTVMYFIIFNLMLSLLQRE